MIRRLKKLLGLCDHTWKIIGRGRITHGGHTVGKIFELQCDKCGNIKRKSFYS